MVARATCQAAHTWLALDDSEPDRDDPAVNDELDAREAERIRRRDRETAAAERELMKPGMGKVFKQILDRQAREASEPPKRRKRA